MRKYITSLRFRCFIEASNGILLSDRKVTVTGKKGNMVITFDTEDNAQKCMGRIADFIAGEEQFFRIDKEPGVVGCNTEGWNDEETDCCDDDCCSGGRNDSGACSEYLRKGASGNKADIQIWRRKLIQSEDERKRLCDFRKGKIHQSVQKGLYAALIQGAASVVGGVLGLAGLAVPILIAPLTVGLDLYAIKQMRGEGEAGDLFKPFSSGYINSVLVMFLVSLFTCLWSLLLVVPGIIKMYEYYFVPYILADEPTISYKEAFARSREMTSGHKMDIFMMQLSFLGWDLLGALTCGILTALYVAPYKKLAFAEMYEELNV